MPTFATSLHRVQAGSPTHHNDRLTRKALSVGAALLAAFIVGGLPWTGLAVAQETAAGEPANRNTLEVSTDLLLQKLVERGDRGMHDVVLWVLDRVDYDEALASLRSSSQLRRGGSLVALSRRELDLKKKSKILEDALKCFDGFLAANQGGASAGEDQISAFTQKGTTLLQRALLAVAQSKSKSSGVDPAAAIEAAVKFFDDAFDSFESAEKAILEQLRGVDKELAALDTEKKGDDETDAKPQGGRGGRGAPPQRRPKAPSASEVREADRMQELIETQKLLRGQLINTRLFLAGARFEKTKAFATGSDGWKKAMDESTSRFAETYTKYNDNKMYGYYAYRARYFEGRNYTVMAEAAGEAGKPEDRKKLLDKAVQTLVNVRLLDGGGEWATLRAKACNTTFECWLELNDLSGFDELAEKVVTTPVSPDKYDGPDGADWLGMKYRGAAILAQRAQAEGPKGKPKLKVAQKIAIEVSKVNRDFAKEARELLAKLGKDVGDDQAASFAEVVDEAGALVGSMETKLKEAKSFEQEGKADEAAKATEEAAAFRDKAIQSLFKAMPAATDDELDKLNKARYYATILLFRAKRLHEAAALGEFLAERYPNAIGSKDAARAAMASWQLLAKEGPPVWTADARRRGTDLADLIFKIWPADPSSVVAAAVVISSASEAGNMKRIMEIIDAVPADSPSRAEVLLRGGTALWRSVGDRRRLGDDAEVAADSMPIGTVLAKAIEVIDAGLGAVEVAGKPDKLAVAAAVARCQMALEAGDNDRVWATLTNATYGPWAMVSGGDASMIDPAVQEDVLRFALLFFIQTERLEEAQKAMDLLEAAAGEGEDAAEKLADMYLRMGRQLQEQLAVILSGAGGELTNESRERAGTVVAGLVKFLDRVASRDKKVSSQMWVASQFMALGAGPGRQGGAIVKVVPKEKRQEFLARAADVYESLLKSDDDKIRDSELAIRLKLATVYRELERWDDAIGHLEWIVRQPKGVNMLSAHWEAATLFAAAGTVKKDAEFLKQAVVGRQGGEGQPVFWGWSGIAKKLQKQALAGGTSEKAAESRRRFFEARLNVPKTRLKRAEIGVAADRKKQLEMAETDIIFTHKLDPDMGGKEFRGEFDKLLEEIQKQLDRPSKRGLDDLDAEVPKPEVPEDQGQKPAA